MSNEDKLIAKLTFYNYFVMNDRPREESYNLTIDYLKEKDIYLTREDLINYLKEEV
jgi:hypothetical protein